METTKKLTNYSIGLDIGTTSVGWAVINDDYSLVRAKGKNLWGVNLFDEGMSAQSRRTSRAARRRLERRKQRIALLRILLQADVLKVDPSFYIKMDESYLQLNDQFGRTNKFNLFNDNDFTDRAFYRRYPTIYHLRKALIENDKKFDIRLVYLTIHHMIKYRGNFLYEGNSDEFKGYDTAYIEDYFAQLQDNENHFIDKIQEIESILLDASLKRKEKVESIKSLFSSKAEQNFIEQFANAVLGLKFDLGFVCEQDDVKDENGKPLKIKFSDSTYEEKENEYIDKVGDGAPLLHALYSLYFALTFKEILGNNNYISYAMCNKFEQHRQDLSDIKGLLKEYCSRQVYKEFFAFDKKDIKDKVCYYNYIRRIDKIKGTNKTPNEMITDKIFSLLEKTCKKDALLADERYKRLSAERQQREILPKLNSKENSYIPYQMNEKELRKILDNQKKYYPTLKENYDKIISLLTFRRPYFVGVLNKNSKFSWYDKDIEGKVYPWNFKDKVDFEYAQKKFIENLTNNCTIFPEEQVLPLNSFLYSEYMVLDELNKIKIKGNLLSPSDKRHLFKDLFCSIESKSKVSIKDIALWINNNLNLNVNVKDISGLHEEDHFANIFKPYRDFKRILGDSFDEKYIPKYEDIIKTITVFSDPETRKSRIEKVFKSIGTTLDDVQIKSFVKLNYSGWGRFSQKVLNDIYSTESTRRTIIEIMRDTTQNFNEIRYDKRYGFDAQMQPQKQDVSNFYAECIENSYCSPSVKKATNQTIKLIDEIIKIMGHSPTAIFIESASEEDENKKNKRIKSKKDTLKEIYNKVEKDCKDGEFSEKYNELMNLVNKESYENTKSTNSAFNSERLYLYFTQLGKCMYSGEPLDVNQLDKYEIDHIIPQSLIKDNSRDNKVLVKKIHNQNKSDNLTLNKEVIDKMTPFWSMLLKMNFINKRKFYSLTRETFDNKDIERFVERQLVETRQTIKEVGKIIKMLPQIEDCEVINVSANACDTLKSSIGYFKVRNLNDYHHAKDAYVAAVLGRVTKHTVAKNNADFRKEYISRIWKDIKSGGLGKTLRNRNGIVVDMINLKIDSILHSANAEYDENGNLIKQQLQMLSKEGEIIWSSEYRDTLLKTLNYNDVLLTKKIEKFANSDFYDQTIYSKDSANAKIPRKMAKNIEGVKIDLPTDHYGGNSSISSAYGMAIKYKKGNKIEKRIVNIPLIEVYKNNVENYLKKEYGEFTVLKDKICKNQMLMYKGQLCYYVSETELNNATQIKGKQYWQEAVCKIFKACDKKTSLSENTMPQEEFIKINNQMRAFVDDFLAQLKKYFPLYQYAADKIKEYVEKGGYDALSFEKKQNFVMDMLKITSTKRYLENFKNYEIEVDGEKLYIDGSDSKFGRLKISAINLDDVVFVNRSITGIWQEKIFGKDLDKEV